MDSRFGTGGLAAIVGLLVLGMIAGTRTTQPYPANQGRASTPIAVSDAVARAAASSPHPEYPSDSLDRPLDEVRDFFGCDRHGAAKPQNASNTSGSLRAGDICAKVGEAHKTIKELAQETQRLAKAHHYATRFLIALLPDPVDSYVGGEFDSYITSLLRGANASEWLLDRHWFPWADSSSLPVEAGKAAGKGPSEVSDHRVSPGIVLFRRDSDEDTVARHFLLVVFVVAESPLTGIHQRSFVDCLSFISEVNAQKGEPDRTQILGPFSSGAGTSVATALETWCKGIKSQVRVDFLSGSATSPELGERLKPSAELCPSLTVGFHSTVVSDRLLQKAAFHFFVEKLKWRPSEIAVLVESDSSYGKYFLMRRDPQLLLLPMPSGLTSVRTAWERSRHQEDIKIGDVKLPAYALELRLEETRTPQDIFPDFRPMTAPLNELKLDELLSTLAREHIRHLGLFFTDVRDKLFLAEQIKRYAPHVSLFTFESSVLFFHPRINPYTDGMLVISSYPLSTTMQQLMGGFADDSWRQVFGSDAEQGFYNAAVLALGKDENPLVTGYLTVPGTSFRGPAIWISGVGDGHMVPLDVIRPYTEMDLPKNRELIRKGSAQVAEGTSPKSSAFNYQADPRPGLSPEIENLVRRLRVPGAFRFWFWIATLGFALMCAFFALGHSRYGELRFRTWLIVFFRPLERPDSSDERQKHGWTLALILACSAFWMALADVYLIPFLARERLQLDGRIAPDPHAGWFLPLWEEKLMRAVARNIPVFAIVLVILLTFVASSLSRTLRSRWRVLLPILAGFGAVVFLLISRWILAAFPTREQIARLSPASDSSLEFPILTYLRASSGPSNLSPLTGLLFLIAGFALLMAFQLQRLRIRDGWRCSVAEGDLAHARDPALRSIAKLQKRLDLRILQPFPRSPWFLALLIVVLLPLLATVFFMFEGATDPPYWSKTFAVVFTILLLASLAAYSRFVSLWRSLRSVINRLESSELLKALEHCKDELEWHALRSWGGSRRHSYSILIRSVEILKSLSHRRDLPDDQAGAEDLAVFDNRAKDVHRILQQALDANAERDVVSERAARVELLRKLDTATVTVQNMLNRIDRAGSTWRDPALRSALIEYVALHAISYIRYVFAEIRNSLLASTLGILFLLAGLASFHFQPIRSVYVLLWSVIGVVAIWTVLIFTQMDRNTLVSKLGGTTPGQINPIKSGLLLRIATFVLPPILALILTQFPRLGQTVLGWSSPLIRVFQ